MHSEAAVEGEVLPPSKPNSTANSGAANASGWSDVGPIDLTVNRTREQLQPQQTSQWSFADTDWSDDVDDVDDDSGEERTARGLHVEPARGRTNANWSSRVPSAANVSDVSHVNQSSMHIRRTREYGADNEHAHTGERVQVQSFTSITTRAPVGGRQEAAGAARSFRSSRDPSPPSATTRPLPNGRNQSWQPTALAEAPRATGGPSGSFRAPQLPASFLRHRAQAEEIRQNRTIAAPHDSELDESEAEELQLSAATHARHRLDPRSLNRSTPGVGLHSRSTYK